MRLLGASSSKMIKYAKLIWLTDQSCLENAGSLNVGDSHIDALTAPPVIEYKLMHHSSAARTTDSSSFLNERPFGQDSVNVERLAHKGLLFGCVHVNGIHANHQHCMTSTHTATTPEHAVPSHSQHHLLGLHSSGRHRNAQVPPTRQGAHIPGYITL